MHIDRHCLLVCCVILGGLLTEATASESAPRPWQVGWQQHIGFGYAPPAPVDAARVVVVGTEREGEQAFDRLSCVDPADGTVLWQRRDPVALAAGKVARFPGHRSAPAVADGRIMTVSHDGWLRSFTTAAGEMVWQRQLTDWGGAPPSWGYATTPFVLGDTAFLHIGGEEGWTVAFAVADGSQRWRQAIGGAASHTRPVLWGDALIVVTATEVVAQDPADGSVHWRAEWRTRGGNNSPRPLAIDDQHLLLSSAYRRSNGPSSRLYRIAVDGSAEIVWEHDQLVMHTTQAVYQDGWLYGAGARIDRDPVGIGCWQAIDGQQQWLHPEINGTLVRTPVDTLLVLTLGGLLVEIAIDPQAWHEYHRLQVFEGDKSYGPPVPIGNDHAVIRTESGELFGLRRQ